MKNFKFYICPICGNVILETKNGEVSCCGQKLVALEAKEPAGAHTLTVETKDNEIYVSSAHAMTKEHYLNFVALVSSDSVYLKRLFPEQSAEAVLPKIAGAELYFGCNVHGLYLQK